MPSIVEVNVVELPVHNNGKASQLRKASDEQDLECGGNGVSLKPALLLSSGSAPTAAAVVGTTTRRLRKKGGVRPQPVRFWLRRVLIMLMAGGALAAVAALIYYYLGWLSLVQLVLVAIVAYIAAGKYRWFYVAIVTAPRDIRALFGYIRLLFLVKSFAKRNVMLVDLLRHQAKQHPHTVCLIFEDQEWDFAKLEDYSNRIANVFKSHGYKKGDVVAVFMENKPEYVATWMGLAKLGVITPLINTNLRLNSLVHSITVAKSQAVIFGSELSADIQDILGNIESKVALYELNCSDKPSTLDGRFQRLDKLIREAPGTPPIISDKLNHHDRLLYIYTSGTTGLPKAAVITNARYIFLATAIRTMVGFNNSDRFYTPLPLYHTAGGCMSVGQMLIFGSTLVIRKKFSASQYFSDCERYKCTVAQYIGEMCRYILSVPPKATEPQHQLRVIFGNGLRPQIWTEFVERFDIPKVAEFYGATEGNANIVNIDNTVGAIGFVSRIIPSVYPISIIRVDQLTGEPIRDAHGLCMQCKPNEPGVFVGKITHDNPSRAFLGYVNDNESSKKVIRDVFHHGDKAFLSGDLLVADEWGNLFFKDRTGDTFRWKGENVSTSEVEGVLSTLLEHKDVVVYGVEVRGQEGRAGMAAIFDPTDDVDLVELAVGTKRALPSYARPIFIRILKKLDMTGTYKLKKTELQNDGFDPTRILDSMFYLNGDGVYTVLSADAYERINNGLIRI